MQQSQSYISGHDIAWHIMDLLAVKFESLISRRDASHPADPWQHDIAYETW
jgi:hypothetical protein